MASLLESAKQLSWTSEWNVLVALETMLSIIQVMGPQGSSRYVYIRTLQNLLLPTLERFFLKCH